MPTYAITFRRNDRLGTEEYDGGHSIEDARREAAFFRANLPPGLEVRICKVTASGGLQTKEYGMSDGSEIRTEAQ